MPAQIKCEFCGGFINDTDTSCPHCGAANANLFRGSSGTPKTIEELQDWYKERKLPAENITRFFIGKNISEPKAFGIYRDGEKIIVYKNKADGSRAVRYEGTDEEYGVREIYLRLKEEILNQKQHSALNKASGSRSPNPSGYANNRPSNASNSYNSYSRSRASTASNAGSRYTGYSGTGYRRRRISKKTIIFLCILALAVVGMFRSCYNKEYGPEVGALYYSDGSLYCYSGEHDDNYIWWKYNTDTDKWEIAESFKAYKEHSFPNGLSKKNKLSDDNKPDYEYPSLMKTREYIDYAGPSPSLGYYRLPDSDAVYYYNRDKYGASYGDGDNSGWYVDYGDGWEYLTDSDDKVTLPEELYYESDIYYWDGTEDDADWIYSDFSGTDWYEDTMAAMAAYYTAENNKNNNNSSKNDNNWLFSDHDWDNDNDWDWDDDDDWDYDYTDWDDDW